MAHMRAFHIYQWHMKAAKMVKCENSDKINERAWKLRALRYAVLPSSSCMLLELMEMLFTST